MNDRTDITIRIAKESDERELGRLAQRDSARTPRGSVLVAEVGGAMRAAISLGDGATIADPFHRTAELVEMLRIRAAATGVRVTQPRGWRITGLRLALASSSRRTGVV